MCNSRWSMPSILGEFKGLIPRPKKVVRRCRLIPSGGRDAAVYRTAPPHPQDVVVHCSGKGRILRLTVALWNVPWIAAGNLDIVRTRDGAFALPRTALAARLGQDLVRTAETMLSVLRKDLHAISADGTAASVMVGIGEMYLPAFVLALSASDIASGLITSVPLVIGALVQLAAPRIIRRLGSYRRWVGCAPWSRRWRSCRWSARRCGRDARAPGLRRGLRLLGGRHGRRGHLEHLGGHARARADPSPLFRPPYPLVPGGRARRVRRRRRGFGTDHARRLLPRSRFRCCSWPRR